MSEDIRKMIDKVKNFKYLVNEGIDEYIILNDEYFIKRVPFFKTFENNSGGEEVRFNHYKNWQGNNAAILHFGKDKGFVKFPFFSVETKFFYFTTRKRDFENESKLTSFKPMFKTEHHFIYSTDIHMDLPKTNDVDEIPNQIASLMFKEIMKENLKFKDSFEIKDGETIPKDKLDNIINSINKNLFKVEETLEKMKLSYF
jgi:hypothetical protein